MKFIKKNKTGFYNSTWQAKQKKKAGKKPDNGVLTRQGDIMRETLKRTTYWECFYPISNQKLQKNGQNKLKKLVSNSKTVFFIARQITPQETFTDLVNLLRPISPKEIKDVSSFAKIARGQRLQYYGW